MSTPTGSAITRTENSVPRPLVVRLCNWIGDVVLSVPALELLERHGYQLHLYGHGWAPKLLSGYPWPCTVRAKSLQDRVKQLRNLRQQLAKSDVAGSSSYAALAMPNSFSSAMELRLAGFSVSGYARDGRSFLLAERLAPTTEPHALQSFWNLACQMTGETLAPPASINLRVSPKALAAAEGILEKNGWQAGYLCVNPFAAGTVHKQPKKWPAFPEFVKKLEVFGLPIIICPGPGEVEEARHYFGQAHILENIPLDTFAAILKAAKLVIANDTGPSHIAAAVGAPLISVLGPTKVEQWSPWGPTVSILSQRPNWPELDEVMVAAQKMLESGLP
jgi:heptosyltransferase-2